jgi:hypothetical protein
MEEEGKKRKTGVPTAILRTNAANAFCFLLASKATREMGRACSTYGKRESYTGFLWGKLSEIDNLADKVAEGSIILSYVFRKWDVGAQNGSSWLMMETGGGQL